MEPVASVVGIGALPVGKYVDVLEHEMLAQALVQAVTDAGLSKEDIDALVFALPRPYCEQRYFGTFMAGYLDMPVDDILLEVLGNGMTGGLAFDLAVDRVASGKAKVAVALGVNREMHVPTGEHMHLSMRAVGDVDFHVPFGVTPIAWYALNATRYMHEYGLTREQLASIPVKNRRHAMLNPLAQMRKEISIQDVLDARQIVRPLGLLDVPPRSDGAVAIVVARPDIARSLGRHVDVVSRGFYHEGIHQVSSRPTDLTTFESARIASGKAYEGAGITASDLDFAEVYAPCSIVELILTESIGLFPRGTGGEAAAAGESSIGGRVPVSPSGGLASRGHPPHVTPLYNVYEAVEQLRGEAGDRQVVGAGIGAVTAELGDYNATLMHILSRPENRA
ncbi:thiolase family protein [Nocardioides marmoriginsengisoli]|uniref:Thiolase family protein n=1 Tax=Nocardioides marmoriginsengisoli TaxID=661483 RepID=A0A3N0CHA4_9ACTN|nr:thiolase family protein [Nocardioides marmoriginsengisoli]RNL62808.1 thiolase family protein [Nocardioides marmoriginsengisoli]